MPRNGTGTYVLPAGQPVVPGTTISSSVFNTFTNDVATALTNSLAVDGQTPMAANLPMGNNKLTGLANGSANGDSVNIGQLASGGSALIGGVVQCVTSVAGIRALLKTSPSKFALASGYYASGDGGGGHFWYDSTDTTSADNGGTIIVASDGGRWKLIYYNIINVRQFGAKGDGSTDDYNAFIGAAGVANTVLVPWTSTSYYIGTAITVANVRWIIEAKLTGPGGLPSITNVPATQFFSDIPAPSGALALQPGIRSVVSSKGDNTTFIGGVAGHFEARDRSDVTALNKGVLYGVEVFVNPIVARNNVPFDDCVGLSITNVTGISGAKATDAIYIAHNFNIFPSSSEWYSGLTIDAFIDVGIQITGRVGSIGFDFKSATMVTGIAMRFGNTHGVYWRNAGDTADLQALKYDANNTLNIGDSSSAGIKFPTWWGGPIPSVQSGTSYTVGATDTDIIFTNASTVTVTLPNPTGFRSGRILTIKTTNGGAVNSASSNVAPLGPGAVGSAILPATAGKWAILKADGVNWTIMAAN